MTCITTFSVPIPSDNIMSFDKIILSTCTIHKKWRIIREKKPQYSILWSGLLFVYLIDAEFEDYTKQQDKPGTAEILRKPQRYLLITTLSAGWRISRLRRYKNYRSNPIRQFIRFTWTFVSSWVGLVLSNKSEKDGRLSPGVGIGFFYRPCCFRQFSIFVCSYIIKDVFSRWTVIDKSSNFL